MNVLCQFSELRTLRHYKNKNADGETIWIDVTGLISSTVCHSIRTCSCYIIDLASLTRKILLPRYWYRHCNELVHATIDKRKIYSTEVLRNELWTWGFPVHRKTVKFQCCSGKPYETSSIYSLESFSLQMLQKKYCRCRK